MWRRLLTILVAVTAGLVIGAPAHASDTAAPVVFVGVPGLSAADLSPTATPTLWRLLGAGAAASLSVRTVHTVTCPADGWLTLGTGARTARPEGACAFPALVRDEPGEIRVGPTPPARGREGGEYGRRRIAGFDAIAAANRHNGGSFGLLATSAARAGCATAIGPGAALALADADGRVDWAPDATVDPASLARCPLTIVDLGRPADLDAAVAAVVAAAPAGATMLIAGLADGGFGVGGGADGGSGVGGDDVGGFGVGDVGADLHIVLAAGPRFGPGRLDTPSTRQPGLVQLTDLTPTIVDALGVAPSAPVVGSVAYSTATTASTEDRAAALRGSAVAADVQRDLLVPFFTVFAVALLGLVGLVLVRGFTAGVGRFATVLAAVPVATFLVNLVPWWDSTHPKVAVLALLAAAVAVVAPAGPRYLGPLTLAVLVADAATGSLLQMCSLYGQSPLIAGRFYGFGNSTFAVFAVAALIGVAVLTRGMAPRRAALAIGLAGAFAVAVDGWPGLGADFGGVLALVPAFALLALWTGGIPVTAVRVALVAGGALALLSAIAVLDWRRPPASRSHLGAFVQQVLDGRAADVLWRKASTNLHSFTDHPLALLVPVALAVVVVLLRRGVFADLRPAIGAVVLAVTIGLLVNDSGATIPAMALTLAIPLTVALRASGREATTSGK